jgi:hypothetical protein
MSRLQDAASLISKLLNAVPEDESRIKSVKQNKHSKGAGTLEHMINRINDRWAMHASHCRAVPSCFSCARGLHLEGNG